MASPQPLEQSHPPTQPQRHQRQVEAQSPFPRPARVNRACEVQWASQSMGAMRPIATTVLERCVADSLNFNPAYGAGQNTFDALQRLVDRIDPSYRS